MVMSGFLRGGRAIVEKLEEMGFFKKGNPNNLDKLYYLARMNKLEIDRFGDEYISTPEKLKRQIEKLVS
jgi:hypothetical protein